MSTKQNKRNKRAKEKARQANKARAHGRKLDAVGRQNYEATPDMVELFHSLPTPDKDEEIPFVSEFCHWSRQTYAFEDEESEEAILQVAVLCILYLNWVKKEGATAMVQNDLIAAAIHLKDDNATFIQRYEAACGKA